MKELTRLDHDQSLQHLQLMRHQSHWAVAVELLGVLGRRYQDDAGSLPQPWYSPQLQTQVEGVIEDATPLVCAGLEEPEADAIRPGCPSCLDLPQRIPNLVC